MPVYERRETSRQGWYTTYERTGAVTYEGLVLAISTSEERIMSDVYATVTYALVWDAVAGKPTTVTLYNSEFGGLSEAEVDATPEVRAAYETYQAEESRKATEAARAYRNEEAQKALLVPCIGHTARVVRGRKVPLGTEGMVVWVDNVEYVSRIGIEDAAGMIHYTAITNAERTDSAPRAGETWFDARCRRQLEERLYIGARVRVLSGTAKGAVGILFFCRDGRVGIRYSDRKEGHKYVDVAWSDENRVCITTDELSPATSSWSPATVDAPVATMKDVPF